MQPVQSKFFAFLLLCFGLFTSINTTAQEGSFLKEFYAYQLNNKLVLKWTISKGNTCFGIKILRSADALQFEEIGTIYGVCGSNSSDEPYVYVDSFPLNNRLNYYKLDFGGQAPSDVISVEFINTGENDYFIDYSGKPKLLFLNPKRESVMLEVYNMSGKLIASDVTSGNKFDFSNNSYPFGIYFFRLNGNYINISGKMFLY